MNLQRGFGWMRRGFSLLWDTDAFFRVAPPTGVVSFAMARSWPDELPGAGAADWPLSVGPEPIPTRRASSSRMRLPPTSTALSSRST